MTVPVTVPESTPVIAPFIDVAELDRLVAAAAAAAAAVARSDGDRDVGSADGHVVIVDSRWYLDGRSGREAYARGHVPGAVYIDLDVWLAGPASPAAGRHPLPEPQVFARGMAEVGIGDSSTVVVYDDAGGVIAARLVWMLRALGRQTAVLDGGIAAWQRAHPGAALETGPVDAPLLNGVPASFTERPWPAALLATIDETQAAAADGSALVLDARTLDRYLGETEPVDARAGHIPGAKSLSCRDNVTAENTLVTVAMLRERLAALGAGEKPVISYCGSGVTACHTLLALEQAGFAPGRLYLGSWSQYAADPSRPVATGN